MLFYFYLFGEYHCSMLIYLVNIAKPLTVRVNIEPSYSQLLYRDLYRYIHFGVSRIYIYLCKYINPK